ncbi:MAG: neutral/alkaline non-lysosomal ceramidase N-terminal domain-containing protein, partial [Planctomycetales bacterium]|nr:neutral/alkaline non-lysosomal ceramidase N-terminal domain-containing protein [Planctomycetales bacterium]
MFQFHFFRRQMIACLALMLLPGVSLWAAEGWQAGVAKVKVTPTVAMPMAGYGSRGNDHSEGTLNDLWVKALVLQDAEGHRGLLVTMDLCGIGRDLSQTLRQQIGQRLNLKPNEILFSTSHTHSGPVVGKYLKPLHFLQLNAADQQLVNEYEEQLAKKVVDCAAEAAAALKPSRLSHGSGHVTFATNRRNNPAGDVLNRRAAGTIVGPADYSVPVLAIHQQDKLVATIFGYACHCTVLSGMQFSGDYAGFAQEALEAAHPDCTAMFWAGCGADQNPLPRGTTDFAEQYGQDLADGVQRVLDGVLRPIE